MKTFEKHPEDLSPYLDRDHSDKRYSEIQAHLAQCAQCRDEVRIWETSAVMLRAPEAQIEVPHFQWQRILARLESPKPTMLWHARAFLQAHQRLAWSAVMGLLLIAITTLSGLWYQNRQSEQHILALIVESEVQWHREALRENPFRLSTPSVRSQNPFERFQYPMTKVNPFALRR